MFRTLLSVRPHERPDTLGAFVTLFGIMSGHAVLETARDALFLARLPAAHLPWVYLGIAAVALALTAVQGRGPARRRPRRVSLALLLCGSAGVTLVLWALVGPRALWSLYLLYAWSGVFSTLVVVRFWTLVQDRFNVSQAKRLFAPIGAGSVLGAIAGSALAGIVSGTLGESYLLPVAAALLLGSAAAPVALLRPRTQAEREGGVPPDGSLAEAVELVRSRPYVRRVGVLLLVSTVTLTIGDWLFKSVAARHVAPEEMGEFFATVYLILNLVSLLMQVAVVGWLLRAFGVSRALGLLPVLLMAGGVGLALGGGMAAALVLKGADGGLRYSVHRTAVEVLYVPLSSELRSRVKGFLDVLGMRGGQALASIAILAAVAGGLDQAWLGAAVVLLAAGWLYLADSLQPHYLELFRAGLREAGRRGRAAFTPLDLTSLESVLGALSSQDDGEVLAALDLLAERNRTRLIPLLILYHPSSRVLLRALEILGEARREDLGPMARRLVRHDEPEVRAAALRSLGPLSPDDPLLLEAREDASPIVRATALVGMVASEAGDTRAALAAVAELAESGSRASRIAVARAMQQQRSERFADVLLVLVRDPDLAVRHAALQAMQAGPSPRFLPALLPLLERRELRPMARAALVTQGPDALRFLEAALVGAETPLRIRRHLPRTLSRFDPRASARILLARLPVEPDGVVRYKILRALGRLRANQPSLPLDAAVLDHEVRRTLSFAFRLLNWRLDLVRGAAEQPARQTPVHALLVQLLADKEEHAVERLFRLLGLLHPREDLHRIHRALAGADANARAGAVELLHGLLNAPVREALLGLVDEVPDGERLAAAGPFHAPRSSGYAAVLQEILGGGGMSLPALAAYHAGELGLEEMGDDLRSLGSEAPPLLRSALERALELMALPASERLAYGA